MRFHKQLFRHRPEEGEFGDCHRTCLAILMDKEPSGVPNFGVHYGNPKSWQVAMDDYLDSVGLAEYVVAYLSDRHEDLLQTLGIQMPGMVFIFSGQSRNKLNHSVIAGHGKILWDPSLDDSGIIGPCDDGFYWVTVLVPRFHKVAKHEIQEN